jgi:hypothetical protein
VRASRPHSCGRARPAWPDTPKDGDNNNKNNSISMTMTIMMMISNIITNGNGDNSLAAGMLANQAPVTTRKRGSVGGGVWGLGTMVMA